MWKSREDKLPPPSFFAMVVAHLQRAYAGARISREMMQTLRPFLIEAWRSGKTAEAAAQSTCSCNGTEIVPSPVIGVRIAKGSVRPPRGAERGEVFGAEDLRSPAAIERLERRLVAVTDKARKQAEATDRSARRAASARKEPTKARALDQHNKALTQRDQLLAEAKDIERQIHTLRSELNSAQRRAQEDAARGGSRPVEPNRQVPPGSIGRRGRKPLQQDPAQGASSPSDPNAAMLSALKGMMPDLAGQLAAEMAREGKKP